MLAFSRWIMLASLALTAAGCDDDDTSPAPSAGSGGSAGRGGNGGSSGGGSGGSAGGGAGGTGSGGDANTAGTAGTGGSAGDAGLDLCVKGPVELFCGSECPTSAEARDELRQLMVRPAELIVERPCLGLDGSERLSVGAGYGDTTTQVFVYDADTRALVAVHFTDDTGACSPDEVEEAGRYVPGWYGAASPDCEFVVPPACEALDAGVNDPDGGDAGADAGPPQCILGD